MKPLCLGGGLPVGSSRHLFTKIGVILGIVSKNLSPRHLRQSSPVSHVSSLCNPEQYPKINLKFQEYTPVD